MVLSNDFYDPSMIYVPRSGSLAEDMIAKGSAVIGAFADRQYDPGRVLVYYEGNLFGAVNLHRFEERCDCAHGRMAQRYPTIAMASVDKDDLILVGVWHPDRKEVEVQNAEALAAWNEGRD